MSNVTIYPNYSLVPDSTGIVPDTVEVDSFRYVDNMHMFRPRVITRVVNVHPGQMYSKEDQELTLNHLLGLGTFKFVNIRLQPPAPRFHGVECQHSSYAAAQKIHPYGGAGCVEVQ